MILHRSSVVGTDLNWKAQKEANSGPYIPEASSQGVKGIAVVCFEAATFI